MKFVMTIGAMIKYVIIAYQSAHITKIKVYEDRAR